MIPLDIHATLDEKMNWKEYLDFNDWNPLSDDQKEWLKLDRLCDKLFGLSLEDLGKWFTIEKIYLLIQDFTRLGDLNGEPQLKLLNDLRLTLRSTEDNFLKSSLFISLGNVARFLKVDWEVCFEDSKTYAREISNDGLRMIMFVEIAKAEWKNDFRDAESLIEEYRKFYGDENEKTIYLESLLKRSEA